MGYIRNVDASSATLFELGLYSGLYPYLSTECSTDQALLELPSSKATESYFCLAFTGQNLQALASCLWPLFVGPTYCTCLSFSRRVALSSIGFAAQRARRVLTGRRPSVRPNLLPAMFGTADSLRKQFGAGTAYTQRLPSLVETDLRAAGGADILDRDRLIALGSLFVQRTGKSLPELWHKISGGSDHCPYDRFIEKLSVAGVGILGPRELGVLERSLKPSSGNISRESFEAAFSTLSAQASDDLAKGQLEEPAGLQSQYGFCNGTFQKPAGQGTRMVGGHAEKDLLSPKPRDPSSRDAAWADEWQKQGGSNPPFAVGEPSSSCLTSSMVSPTYAVTTDKPPFATGTIENPPAASDGSTRSSFAPYATSDNVVQSAVYYQPADVSYGSLERRSEKKMPVRMQSGTAPYACGNGWE